MRTKMKARAMAAACVSGLLLIAALSGCNSSSSSSKDKDSDKTAPRAETAQGVVEGFESGNMIAFRGIPYAAPPVGELRFAPTRPAVDRGEDVLVADEFGSGCPQVASAFGDASLDEDCLFLNVYRPKEDGSYPVMVWIHGGALIAGSGGDSYEPSRLVEKGVVVVTLNYRLGALGFLPHASLREADGSSGNYGLMDQQEALRWVQANIESFAGDPGNVTIFGESAGGHSVLSQMVMEGREGLFHKAIVQSGAYNPDQLPQALAEMMVGAPYAAEIGCATETDIAACLREKSVQDILDAQGDSWFVPTPGAGVGVLQQSITDGLSDGDFEQVPVLAGGNLTEGRLFIVLDIAAGKMLVEALNPNAASDYVAAIKATLDPSGLNPEGLDMDQIAQDYLAATEAEVSPLHPHKYHFAFAAMQTDWRFACNKQGVIEKLAGHVPTYAYWFTDENAPGLFPPIEGFPMGATHAFEIQYVLNTEKTMRDRGAGDEQIVLSEAMIDYWTQFAKHGDPNSESGTGTSWPNFATSSELLELDTGTLETRTATEFKTFHNCDYWMNPPKL